MQAAKRAQLHDTIMAQPGGYDAIVGERGLKLSGRRCAIDCVPRGDDAESHYL